MSRIVTPPWDLCGFDPRHDPYGLDESEIRWCYGELLGLTVSGQLKMLEWHLERDVDPNRRDGEWTEVVFMPWHAVPWLDFRRAARREPAYVLVPSFLTVSEALFEERRVRMERRFVGEFWRGALSQVAVLEERITSVHEMVACPKCVAEVGVPCRDLRPGRLGNTKHPHRERLRAAGISVR